MNRITITCCCIVLALLTACKSPEKLNAEGWKYFTAKNYPKAQQRFSKLLKSKSGKSAAMRGLGAVSFIKGEYKYANVWYERLYRRGMTSDDIYIYAKNSRLLEMNDLAINLLYELYRFPNVDSYKKDVLEDKVMSSMFYGNGLYRFLSGYRRIKIQPVSAYSNEKDGLLGGANDLFTMVVYDGVVVLCTKPVEDENRVTWFQEYVILDYKVGSELLVYLYDDDIYSHDRLVSNKIVDIKTGNVGFGNGSLQYKIEDTEAEPYTTGVNVPSNRNLAADLLLVGGATYVLHQSTRDLDHSFLSRLLKCSISANLDVIVNDPKQAAVIEEAYNAVVEKRGYSTTNVAKSVLQASLTEELKRKGHADLAALLEGASFAECLLEK